MKNALLLIFLLLPMLQAQESAPSPASPPPAAPEVSPSPVEPPAEATPEASPQTTEAPPVESSRTPESSPEPIAEKQIPNLEDTPLVGGGTWVKQMRLNDLMQVMTRKAGRQYFSNPAIDGLTVTGHLLEKPFSIETMREITFPYGLQIYEKGDTVYALTDDQIKLLPKKELTYAVKYLRGRTEEDQKKLLELVKPHLSAAGSVYYEDKTGTLVVIDNEYAVQRIEELLAQVDRPKRQIIVDVKILRLFANRANRFGVDWSRTLGAQGLTLGATAYGRLNEIFRSSPVFAEPLVVAEAIGTAIGASAAATTAAAAAGVPGAPVVNTSVPTGTAFAPPLATQGVAGPGLAAAPLADAPITSGVVAAGVAPGEDVLIPRHLSGIVLTPIQLVAVLRFLQEAEIAKQESGPAIITEDNELGIFRIVDRIPIVEQTVTQTTGVNNISTNVRYRIDPSDPVDPENSREVGVSVAVTPSILPDGTIRMRLLPRVATITGFTRVATGDPGIFNEYPRVNETSVETFARIPNGFSLLLGGYYQTEESANDNKVPFFGDIPGLSFAFRSKQREKVRSNIVFVLTPTAYDPDSHIQTVEYSEMLRQQMTPPKSLDSPDDEQPNENTKPNLWQRIQNMNPFLKEPPDQHLLSPDNPANENFRPVRTRQQVEQQKIQERIHGEIP